MTLVQKLGLTIGILGVLAGSATQLTDILSPLGSVAPVIVKEITSLAAFIGGILGFVLAFITGQAGAIRTVEAMPGFEKLLVNERANKAVAELAVSEDHPKIEAIPRAQTAVEATAKGE